MKNIGKWMVMCCLLFMGMGSRVMAEDKVIESTQKESLKYDVYYHWGFIWKKAGSGILSLHDEKLENGENRLHGRLAGRSLSIVESLMKVRDTLYTYMTPNYLPLGYAKLTHEGSYNAKEYNYYNYLKKDSTAALTIDNIDSTYVDIFRWRQNKGNSEAHFTIAEPGYDMLSIFYTLRRMNFSMMRKGEEHTFYIFSGIAKTPMHIQYRGMEVCEMRNGRRQSAYRLELYFKSKDSDKTPLQVWLSTDASHKPLKVIIQLKRIGSIQGELVE